LHQVGTSSLLIYMMHGHTYIKFTRNSLKVNIIAFLGYERNEEEL